MWFLLGAALLVVVLLMAVALLRRIVRRKSTWNATLLVVALLAIAQYWVLPLKGNAHELQGGFAIMAGLGLWSVLMSFSWGYNQGK